MIIMSVNDPLLKELKVSVLKLIKNINEKSYIGETHVGLKQLFISLEKIFSCGLKNQENFVFIKHVDAWNWLENIGSIDGGLVIFKYYNAVKFVKQFEGVKTNTGRLRALIRCCLNEGCLHVPVQYLISNSKLRNSTYKTNSILGDEILSQIFYSVLLQLSRLKFQLEISNSSFLDVSWELPEVLKLELVPCKNLGISISFVQDKAVIVNIHSNSVVSENGSVAVGDVVDSLNGVHLCSSVKGKLNSIVKNSKGQPILMKIIKHRNSKTNELFPPIVSLMKQIKIDPQFIFSKRQSKDEKPIKKNGFTVKYVGSSYVGSLGNIKQIDKAYNNLMSPIHSTEDGKENERNVVKKIVNLDIGELGIKIYDSETSELILQHSFMEISACGSVNFIPNFFAYIVGDSYCDVATDFTCHLFYSKSTDLIFTVLQSIGQGFHRTHYAV